MNIILQQSISNIELKEVELQCNRHAIEQRSFISLFITTGVS